MARHSLITAVLIAILLFVASPGFAQPVTLTAKKAGHCSVFVPDDWTANLNAQISTLDAIAPDRGAYAGWGVVGVNMGMRPFYGSMYGPPEESILTVANMIGQQLGISTLQYVAPEEIRGYFASRRLRGIGGHRVVLYHIYPNGPSQYIESMYFAIAKDFAG